MTKYKLGQEVKIINAVGLEQYGLEEGDVGTVANILNGVDKGADPCDAEEMLMFQKGEHFFLFHLHRVEAI